MAQPQLLNDASLPPPWHALLDPTSGYTYYWNPVTNVTQYERPKAESSSSAQSYGGSSYGQSYGGGGYSSSSYGGGGGGYSSSRPSTVNATVAPPRKVEIPDVKASQEAIEWRKKHDMTVQGKSVPDPFFDFPSTNFPHDIMQEIDRAGYSNPTLIQAQAWPLCQQGRDVVGIAKTGSGKTCAFLLPGLLHIRDTRKDPRNGPTVLILAPTRELAVQIQGEAAKFGRSAGIRHTCVYGGASKGPQLRDIRSGVHIVIATPGRLNDFLEQRLISLHQVSYLVLDEADRMLDMGFEPQIQKIVQQVPTNRQTLFFSATWPKEVQSIARQFVNNEPTYIFIGNLDSLSANPNIKQHILVMSPSDKDRSVYDLLRTFRQGDKVLIFCSTKRTCDSLAYTLNREFGAHAIHGDKSQSDRDYVLRSFKNGHSPIMVATDVAARGLDIDNVTAVINYDFPPQIEDYVHRIGRTGRAGAKGDAYTFFTPQDARHARDLCDIIRKAGQEAPPELASLIGMGGGKGRSRYGRGGGGGGGGRGFGGGGGRGFGGGGGGGFPSRSFGGGSGSGSYGGSNGYSNGDTYGRSRSRSPRRDRSPRRSRSRSPHYRRRSRSRSPRRH